MRTKEIRLAREISKGEEITTRNRTAMFFPAKAMDGIPTPHVVSSDEQLTTNGRLLKFKEFVSHKTDDETRFSHSRVSEKDQFEVVDSPVRGGLSSSVGRHFHGVVSVLLFLVCN